MTETTAALAEQEAERQEQARQRTARLDGLAALNAFSLSAEVGVATPDTIESAGAQFLTRVRDAYVEALRERGADTLDDDDAHELADSSVPVYTHELWTTFTDLAAYTEDVTEFGPIEDLTKGAQVALYAIASRLLRQLNDTIID